MTNQKSPYRYKAQMIKIIDGDTVDVKADLGFNITRSMRLRLKGVDTNEIFGVEKESTEYKMGMGQKRFVAKWVSSATDQWDGRYPLIVRTYKDSTGKYGRYLADIEPRTTEDITINGFTVKPSLVEALKDEYPKTATDD
jgi:micrococcal nuclease